MPILHEDLNLTRAQYEIFPKRTCASNENVHSLAICGQRAGEKFQGSSRLSGFTVINDVAPAALKLPKLDHTGRTRKAKTRRFKAKTSLAMKGGCPINLTDVLS